MAERHTVDVDVVGSKPIRLPNRFRLEAVFCCVVLTWDAWVRLLRRCFTKTYLTQKEPPKWGGSFCGLSCLLSFHIPDGTWRVVRITFAEDKMVCSLLVNIHLVIIAEWIAETIGEYVRGVSADEGR